MSGGGPGGRLLAWLVTGPLGRLLAFLLEFSSALWRAILRRPPEADADRG